jgi:hypothetical protein
MARNQGTGARYSAQESGVRKRSRLRLVIKGEGDATRIFDDLDKLRADVGARPSSSPAPESPLRSRRVREAQTFARMPHDRALDQLYRHRVGEHAWAVLIELDRMILAQRGKNPVLFWSPRLRALGLTTHTRRRALRNLEAAGVVKVAQRGRGLSPWVTHLWYPLPE